MTPVECRAEMLRLLDELPEKALQDVLNYIRLLTKQPEGDTELAAFMRQSLIDDAEVLKRLAD
jgi:hypothetical protein